MVILGFSVAPIVIILLARFLGEFLSKELESMQRQRFRNNIKRKISDRNQKNLQIQKSKELEMEKIREREIEHQENRTPLTPRESRRRINREISIKKGKSLEEELRNTGSIESLKRKKSALHQQIKEMQTRKSNTDPNALGILDDLIFTVKKSRLEEKIEKITFEIQELTRYEEQNSFEKINIKPKEKQTLLISCDICNATYQRFIKIKGCVRCGADESYISYLE